MPVLTVRGASQWCVSVAQSFSTTTSMGRLTLNIPLSFAQFEREVAAEHIRAEVKVSRMQGIFMGGNRPTVTSRRTGSL